MIETVLNVTAVQTLEAQVFGEVMSRRGNRGHGPATQNVYRCGADDWVAVAVRNDAEWRAMIELIGPQAEELAGADARRDRADAVDELLAAWFAAQDAGVESSD